MNPADYGWTLDEDNSCVPVFSKADMIPEDVTKVVSCQCKTGCANNNCGCRKLGMHCTKLCGNCCGESCANKQPVQSDNDFESNDSINLSQSDEFPDFEIVRRILNESKNTEPENNLNYDDVNDPPCKKRKT